MSRWYAHPIGSAAALKNAPPSVRKQDCGYTPAIRQIVLAFLIGGGISYWLLLGGPITALIVIAAVVLWLSLIRFQGKLAPPRLADGGAFLLGAGITGTALVAWLQAQLQSNCVPVPCTSWLPRMPALITFVLIGIVGLAVLAISFRRKKPTRVRVLPRAGG